MKKIICLALCLSVLCVIALTTAYAANPAIVVKVTPGSYVNGKTVTAYVNGAPAKSGYYSSAYVSLTATFRYGNGTPMAGKTYKKSASDSANGDWGKGTRQVRCSVTGSHTKNDTYVSRTTSGLYQYYKIKQY